MSRKGQRNGSDPKTTMSSNGKASSAGAPPANAWSQPLRTKPNVASGPPPGMGKSKGQTGSSSGSGGGGGSNGSKENALRERFIGLNLNLVGQKVVVTQTNGAVFEGIFHTFSPFATLPASTKNKYVIKACRIVKPPQTEDAKNSNQVVDQSTVIISADKVACLTAKSMRIDTMAGASSNGSSQKKNADDFRTDTEISGAKGGRSRDLVAAGSAWTTGGKSRADAMMGALDDKEKGPRRNQFTPNPNAGGLGGSIGEWDQFRANQELFNVKATFDENLYTTELDKSQIDNRKKAEAERLAREIENTTSTNVHIAEERGHKLEGDYDEEDLYSGVLKQTAIKTVLPNAKAKAENQEKTTSDNQKSVVPKKMNYAAAAAKADTTKKAGPPGFSPGDKESKDTPPAESEEGDEEVSKETADEEKTPQREKSPEVPDKVEETKEKKTEQKPDVSDAQEEKTKTEAKETSESVKPKTGKTADAESEPVKEKDVSDTAEKSAKIPSKLNANAKTFTLKVTAKPFVPGGGGSSAPPAPASDGHFVESGAAMHVAQPMPGHPYMPGPMGQGMMPMINTQYRYPGYAGMDQQHMPPMQPQPQHVASAQGSGAPSPGPASVDDNASQPQQEGDASAAPAAPLPQQQQQPGQPPQQQQQQVPVPYGVPPPGAYYPPGGMAMHPRGPGAPHPGYHHPQFVGGPQQIPVGPGGAPYRHMYPMQPGGMAPNVQVRGPGGPYYGSPVAPVPYPPNAYVGHGMMDDDSGFRGGGRGSRGGRGRGHRNRGGRGRGGRYNSYNQHGGRHSGPHQNGPSGPSENWSSADGGGAPSEGGMGGQSSSNEAGKSGEKGAKQ